MVLVRAIGRNSAGSDNLSAFGRRMSDAEAQPGANFLHTVRAPSAAELAQSLDELIYTTLADQFGQVEEKQNYNQNKPRSPKIEELRRCKKELKKARKLLHSNGQQGSEADKLISRQWFQTMHEHNRLTRAFREREAQKHDSQQQRKFKKDPMKFVARAENW